MVFNDTFNLAISAFRANKLRSILTLLGIIIGVMTIIAMQSLITGLRKSINEQVSFLGNSVFSVQKWPAVQMGPRDEKYRNRKNITYEDALAVRERVTAAKSVGAEIWNWGYEIRYKDRKTLPNVPIAGVTPEFLENNGMEIAEGRFITTEDVEFNAPVTVLGADVVDKLFPLEDPIGKDIKLMGKRLEVVGVFAKKGSVFGQSQDNRLAIPFMQFVKLFGKERSVDISVQAATPELLETAIDQTIGVMRTQRKVPPGKENDF